MEATTTGIFFYFHLMKKNSIQISAEHTTPFKTT
jgi:hypothetical protein